MNITIRPADLTDVEQRAVVEYWLLNARLQDVDETLTSNIRSWDPGYAEQLIQLYELLSSLR